MTRSPLLALVWLLALGGFVALALHAAGGHVSALDLEWSQRARDLPASPLDALLRFDNWLGNTQIIGPVVLLLALAAATRSRLAEPLLLLSAFVAFAGELTIKRIVQEARPPFGTFRDSGLSFPSGHTIGISVVCGLLWAAAPHLTRSPAATALLRVIGLVLVGSVGLARVWSGDHWPTDVIGGYLYSIAFLIPAIGVYSRQRREA